MLKNSAVVDKESFTLLKSEDKDGFKWYFNNMGNWFYSNLEENISKGAPSEAFLWPEYLTTKQKGTYGYVMKLRPKDYYEFGQYLLARAKFKSFEAMVNAAMKICEGFKALHLSGLSYQDLNDGNFSYILKLVMS